jgi:hypothetical protein
MLTTKSNFISNYVKNSDSEFVLYYKYLTHSDLPTFGKATGKNMLHKNLLYYLSTQEMKDIEKEEEIKAKKENRAAIKFATAKQSNIGLPKRFWQDLGMNDPRNTVGAPIDDRKINNFANVYLVNDALQYFNYHYTRIVFNKLNKTPQNNNEWLPDKCNVLIDENRDLTKIELTHAVHGIGIDKDTEFRKLRHNMFKNDMLFLLIEKNIGQNKNLFIIPYKNPKFFTIIGESNYVWEQYRAEEQRRLESLTSREEKMSEQSRQTRIHQEKWRNLLAEEMMNYTVHDGEVFCPFTGVTADFKTIGTIFRASHIKPYIDCSDEEEYDINNGLLLLASADALFDKHYITIGENKEIIFSFLLDQNQQLKNQLLLNQPIFKDVFNAKRMQYMAIHRQTFERKEEERKTQN